MSGVILDGLMGSHSYGTQTPESDRDTMSVHVHPIDHYLGTKSRTQSVSTEHEGNDHVAFEFLHFVKLCRGFNPNVIPLLWLRPEEYLIETSVGHELIKNRDMFNSKLALRTFGGFALGQLVRMQSGDPTGKWGAKRKAIVDEYGYDIKAAMHAVRLGHMLYEFMLSKSLYVYRSDAEYLLRIRNGEMPVEDVVKTVQASVSLANSHIDHCGLPDLPDDERINRFCVESLRRELAL